MVRKQRTFTAKEKRLAMAALAASAAAVALSATGLIGSSPPLGVYEANSFGAPAAGVLDAQPIGPS